jgi:hypothetical protein
MSHAEIGSQSSATETPSAHAKRASGAPSAPMLFEESRKLNHNPRIDRRKLILAAAALGGLYVLSKIPSVEASNDNASIEIYKAMTDANGNPNIPDVADGKYDMTPKFEVEIDGKKYGIDEWNDATWIEVPKLTGNITAYSGYKHDDKFLYMAHAVLVTHLGSGPGNELSGATTEFDPKHDGKTKETKQDNFQFNLLHKKNGSFEVSATFPYPSSWSCPSSAPDPPGCQYTCCDDCSPCKRPEDLIGSSSFGVTPFGSTPYLFYEARVPLTSNQPYCKYGISSSTGIRQYVFNQGISDNMYPGCESGNCIPKDFYAGGPNAFAYATLSKRTNPSPTTPPTVVPEFPMETIPITTFTSLGLATGGLYAFNKSKRAFSRRAFIGLPKRNEDRVTNQ